MAKIFSGLTLIIAVVATILGLQSKGLVEKLQVAAERDHKDLLDTRDKLKKTEKELADTKAELTTTKEELAKTKDTLVKTEADLAAAKTELAATTTKLATAETDLATIKKQLADIMEGGDPNDLKKKIEDIKMAKAELETKVTAFEKEIAELTEVNKTLTAHKKESEDRIASQHKVIDRYQKNIMLKGTRGDVLAVNAGWGFCVLSVGDRKGAAANKIMIVTGNGQAIGKVKIINVEASQSVADIIPSSFVRGAYVQPGDEVIYTGEDKVREEPADAAVGKAPAANNPPGALPLPPP